MKRRIRLSVVITIHVFGLVACVGRAERELQPLLDSRPPGPTMPYDTPRYLLDRTPNDLPFPFGVPAGAEVIGTVQSRDRDSGTILLFATGGPDSTIAYFSELFAGSAFVTDQPGQYQVFYPAGGHRAAYCGEDDTAIFIEVYGLEGDGVSASDVRVHYSVDPAVIERTVCGQPIQSLADFPLPHLTAPPAALELGGGGGGGGGSVPGPYGFAATTIIITEDDLAAVNAHYVEQLFAEGWTLLGQADGAQHFESEWDFGYYATRSWLARLIVTPGDEPDQYVIELRAVSP